MKNWRLQMANKKKMVFELLFCVLYGLLSGVYLKLDKNPETGEENPLGFLLLILLTPTIFQQSCLFILNTMVKDKESKMKESLKIMGLNKSVYALSYIGM
jgi:hypothetical protein